MPVRPPDETEVAALAASYGMKPSAEEVAAYTPIVAAFLSSYDAVEELYAGIAPQAPTDRPSSRVTTVASCRGTKPSRVCEPFIIGTPATATLSLMATVRPASGPSAAPRISVVTYQAPSGLSASAGRLLGRSVGAWGAIPA